MRRFGYLAVALLALTSPVLAQTVSSPSQTTYPNVFFDNFPGSSLSGSWAGAITGVSMPTVTVTGNTATFAGGTNYRNIRVWTLASGGATAIRAKRIRMKWRYTSNTAFAGPWPCVNSNGTTGYGIHAYLTAEGAYTIRRVTNIENGTPAVAESTINDFTITNSPLNRFSNLPVWIEVDCIPSGGTTTYTTRIYNSDGVTLLASWSTSAQSNANTDTAAYPAGFSTDASVLLYAYEVYALDAPQLYATGAGSYPVTTGATKSFTAAFGIGVAGTGPNTYQWQESTNSGSTWANVSTGSGGTSLTWTSPTITGGMSGYQYRCVATDTGTSKTNTSGVYTFANTTNPTLASATVATGGYSVTLNWSSSLTYPFPAVGDFTLSANGSPVLITGVSHSGSTTTLTLGTPVFSDIANVQLSFTGSATDGSSNAVAAITSQIISNGSTLARPNFSAATSFNYNDVKVRAGKGRCDIPVDITRTGGNTDSLTLSVTGLPSGATATVVTQPGTGNSGLIRFTASSGVSGIGTTVNGVISVTNGSQTNSSAFTFTPYSNSLPTNSYTQLVMGNSIINFGASNYNNVNTLFGGSPAWTWGTQNAYGVVGSNCDHWTPAYTNATVTLNGMLHSSVSWGIQNNARVAAWFPVYTNDAGTAWSTLSPKVSSTLQYLADNFDTVVVWPVVQKWGSRQLGSATTVSSYSAGTPSITLASATNVTAGNWIAIANGESGGCLAIRRIASASGAVATLERAYNCTVTNGMTATIYDDVSATTIRADNTGIKNFCTNVAGASAPISNVYWYDGAVGGLSVDEVLKDYMNSDLVHLSPNGYTYQANTYRDYMLARHLLKDSTITISPAPVVLANGTKTVVAGISGYSAYGGTSAWPGALVAGSWANVSGPGSINSSTGVLTPSGTLPTTVSYTLSNATALSGQGKVVTLISRKTSGGIVGRRKAQ